MRAKVNRIVLPSHREVEVPAGGSIVAKTDLDGRVTHVSPDLQRISGYREVDLLGHCESLLHHPDVPDAVYKDLWRDLATGRPWRSVLKCMSRRGDHFWIVADVVPIEQRGEIAGYMWSGRRALRYEIDQAQFDYRRLHSGGALMRHGRVVSRTLSGRFAAWYRNRSVGGKLLLNGAPAAIALLGLGAAFGGGGLASGSAALWLAAAFILFVAATGIFASRLVSRPLREAEQALRQMAEGNFDSRVEAGGQGGMNDEVGRLLQNIRKLQVRLGYDVERMLFGAVHRQLPAPAAEPGEPGRRPVEAGAAAPGLHAEVSVARPADGGVAPHPGQRRGHADPMVAAAPISVPGIVAGAVAAQSLEPHRATGPSAEGGAATGAAIEGELLPAADEDERVSAEAPRQNLHRTIVANPQRVPRHKIGAPVAKIRRRQGGRASLQDEWNES